jgi:uncharacterized protein YciI
MVPGPETVGLCFSCRFMRSTGNRRGSVFFRCLRADDDPRFLRYPPLPVRSCPGYEVTMLFVVLMHYTRPLADVDAVRAEHVRHLERYADRGLVQAWARRDPPSGGVLIVGAPDRAAIEAIVAEDPYVKTGVAKPEVVEFKPENVRGMLQTAQRRTAGDT